MKALLIFACFLHISVSAVFSQTTDTLPLNHYRFLASHNSYKKKPDPSVIRFLTHFKRHLSGELDPIQLDYGHEPLTIQLDTFGVRGFELDLHYDPKGGHLAKRRVNFFIRKLKQRSRDSAMYTPGYKVLHIADVDYESNYATFRQALIELRDWSLRHPDHTPLFINIEVKSAAPADYSKTLKHLGFHKALPLDQHSLQELDNEITGVFHSCPDKIISPQNLRSTYPTISERLDGLGWPTLAEMKGKLFFILDGDPVGGYSTDDHRPMFVYGPPGEPNTAFVIANEPIGKENQISEWTSKYMVRTRSDAGTLEARKNDYTRWEAALRSGAQIISTDYYRPDLKLSGFCVRLATEIIQKK